MLNVCMERRSIREGGLPFSMLSPKRSVSHHEDSDDEFFDCANEDEEGQSFLNVKSKSFGFLISHKTLF